MMSGLAEVSSQIDRVFSPIERVSKPSDVPYSGMYIESVPEPCREPSPLQMPASAPATKSASANLKVSVLQEAVQIDGSQNAGPESSEKDEVGVPPPCMFRTNFCPLRFKRSCYFDATVRWGVHSFKAYNHMLLPISFSGLEDEYHNLKKNVCLWDVAAERQLALKGPDAIDLAELLTPRAMRSMKVGDNRYAIIVDEKGKVLNDPIALRIAEDEIWFSLADSDMLYLAKGLALGKGMDVEVKIHDVSPLAVQGPRSIDLMKEVFGDWVEELQLFKCQETTLNGNSMVIARSGWSPERGYEIYLRDTAYGNDLYELMMQTGQKYKIKPGVPNTIRRIEGGMLSFGADMDEEYNVMELGLPEAWSGPGKKHDFLGKKALQSLVDAGGPKRKIMGLLFVSEQGRPQIVPMLSQKWPVFLTSATDPEESECGYVTSACFSPGMNANIAIATLWGAALNPDTYVTVRSQDGRTHHAIVRKLPFLPRAG